MNDETTVRRTFGRRNAVLLAGGGVLSAVLPVRASVADMVEPAPGLFVRVGVTEDATADNKDAIANIGFIVGREAVAVIDPGGSLADGQALRSAVRERTSLPIRYVILSHIHPDHILGSPAFIADNPVFIGHAALPDAIAERGEFYRAGMHTLLGDQGGAAIMPGRTIATIGQIDLGGRVLELRAHGPAHSGSDLTVLDRTTSTLWAADLMFETRVPSLDGSVRGWLRELAALETTQATRVIPGHGPASMPWPRGSANLRRYLETLASDVRKVLDSGGDLEDAVQVAAQSERGRWQLFDDYNPHNIAHAVHELEWENTR
jgi:quinoprotein relay system zinc metallohydrolase 2